MGTRYGEQEPEQQDAPVSPAVPALLLHLSYLRRSAIVGRALAEVFPTEADWLGAVNDPAFRTAVVRFAQVIDTVREQAVLAAGAEDALELGAQHYDAAIEAVSELAERIGVAVDDLLTVALYA